jgi:hypothetical protein
VSINFYEKVESRGLTESREDKSIELNYVSTGSNDPVSVRAAALLDLPRVYAGLYRKDLNVRHRGGELCDINITYGLIMPGEVLGEEPEPPATLDPDAPLPLNYSFTTSGGTTHIKQSRATVLAFRRGTVGAVALGEGAGLARDYKQAINVTEGPNGEVAGVDIVTAQAEFSLDARRGFISQNYFSTLFRLTGTVNNAAFKGFLPGEVLYLGCEGKSENGAWLLTHKFSAEPNQIDLAISPEITVTQKLGWDYLWVGYSEKPVSDNRVRTAEYAYVEQVYRKTNFAQLEIGV